MAPTLAKLAAVSASASGWVVTNGISSPFERLHKRTQAREYHTPAGEFVDTPRKYWDLDSLIHPAFNPVLSGRSHQPLPRLRRASSPERDANDGLTADQCGTRACCGSLRNWG